MKICLASDNYSPAHPSIIEAIARANVGHAVAYGGDPWTASAEAAICTAFEAAPRIFMTPTGTGTNVLALKICCDRHESVICSDIAHIHYQESGAVESIVGCKLINVPSKNGKIYPEDIQRRLQKERAFGKHSTSPSVLSITQPTEVGTVYTLQELRALADLCRSEKLLMHIDGCRMYNAAVSLNCSLAKIVQAANADILSLGGTKNGLMCVESLLIFNKDLEKGSDHLHKQSLQLFSKMRYLSAQYLPFFENQLWKTLATQANNAAKQLAKALPQIKLHHPVESNQIFFSVPQSWIKPIQDRILCHVWDKEKNELRFITSWNTTQEEIDVVRDFFFKL